MHTANLLDQLTPELIPFIIKNLSIQDLYNCHSINDTWKKEVSLKLLKRPKREQLIYRDLIFHKLYYQPEGVPLGPGYYQTAEKMWDVCKKRSLWDQIGYKFTLAEIEDWLNKQALHQLLYKPPQMTIRHIRPPRFRPIRSSDLQLGRFFTERLRPDCATK